MVSAFLWIILAGTLASSDGSQAGGSGTGASYLEEPPLLKSLGIEPRILPFLSFRHPDASQSASAFDLGLAPEAFEAAWRRTVAEAVSGRCEGRDDQRNVDELADRLRPQVHQALAEALPGATPEQTGFFTALFVSYWVAVNAEYGADESLSAEDLFVANAPANALRRSGKPRLVCSGFSVLTRDLAKALGKDCGLKGRYVWGWFRHQRRAVEATEGGNHGWVLFDIGKGLSLPSDVTTLYYQIKAVGLPKTSLSGDVWVLPRRWDQLEFFFCSRWGLPLERDSRRAYDVNINPEFTDQRTRSDPSMSLSWDAWRRVGMDHLRRLEKPLQQQW